MMDTKRLPKRRGGQALVELSLVSVFLILLALGIIQIGVIVSNVNTLAQLNRDATRVAAQTAQTDSNKSPAVFSDTTGKSQWSSYLQQECSGTSIKFSDLGLGISPTTVATSGTTITLTMTYDLKKKLFLPLTFPGMGAFSTVKTMTCTMVDLS